MQPDVGLALLGAVIGTNGEALDDIRVRGDDFPEPGHGAVFDAAKKLHDDGQAVDFVTLSSAVPEHHRRFVSEALDWTGMAYNVREWARLVEHHGVHRRVAQAGAAVASIDPGLSAADMIDCAQAIVSDLADRTVKPQYKFVRELVEEALVHMAEDTSFIESPWRSVNQAIGGFRPGAVYVVAARPGVGKTVIAAQIATALADHGAVAFSSLEMSGVELAQRFISERAMVNVARLKNNRMEEFDFEKIRNRRHILDNLNIAIDDRTSIGPSDVRGFVRGLSKKHDVSGVVVDYLQLMSGDSKSERYAAVTEFSRQMKIIAKDFNVPVIVLSQLNRQSESRSDGIPKISDLRESGAIEQDADCIFLLRREGEQPGERMIIDVAKNRHGETVECELDWQGIYSRAVDVE